MSTENNKINRQQKFAFKLLQIIDLKSSNEYVALPILSMYHTSKNIRQKYESSKSRIIAPTWNHEFELSDGFYLVSDIQYYIAYIIKKHKTLPTNPPIHIYISRVNNS